MRCIYTYVINSYQFYIDLIKPYLSSVEFQNATLSIVAYIGIDLSDSGIRIDNLTLSNPT